LIRRIDLSSSTAADPRVGGIFFVDETRPHAVALGGGTPHVLAAQGIDRVSR
jgi:hypothetical protein